MNPALRDEDWEWEQAQAKSWPMGRYENINSEKIYYDESDHYPVRNDHDNYIEEKSNFYEHEGRYNGEPHHELYNSSDSTPRENFRHGEWDDSFPKIRHHASERLSTFDSNRSSSGTLSNPQKGSKVSLLRHVRGHQGSFFSFDDPEPVFRNLERYGKVAWAKRKDDGHACLIRFREDSAADALFQDTGFLSRWGLSLHYFSDLLKSGEETQDSKFTLLMRPTFDGSIPKPITFYDDINEKKVIYIGFKEKTQEKLSINSMIKASKNLEGVRRICLGKNRYNASLTFDSQGCALAAIYKLNDKPLQPDGPEMKVRFMVFKEEAYLDKKTLEDVKFDIRKSNIRNSNVRKSDITKSITGKSDIHIKMYCGVIDEHKDQFKLNRGLIYKAFIPYGTIIDIEMGSSNVIAYVSFKSKIAAKKAIEALNLKSLKEEEDGPIVNLYLLDDQNSQSEKSVKVLPKLVPLPSTCLYCYVCDRKDFPSIPMYEHHLRSTRHENYLKMRTSKNRATLGLLKSSAELADKIAADRIKYKAEGFTEKVGETAERLAFESLLSSTKCSTCKFSTNRLVEYLSHLCSLNHLKLCYEAGNKKAADDLDDKATFEDVEKDISDAREISSLCPIEIDNPPIYDKNECFGLEYLERTKEYSCEPCGVTINFCKVHSHSKSLVHFSAIMECLKRKAVMRIGNEEKDESSSLLEESYEKISISNKSKEIKIENGVEEVEKGRDTDEVEKMVYDENGDLLRSDEDGCFNNEGDLDDGYEKDWMDHLNLDNENKRDSGSEDDLGLQEVGDELENLYEEEYDNMNAEKNEVSVMEDEDAEEESEENVLIRKRSRGTDFNRSEFGCRSNDAEENGMPTKRAKLKRRSFMNDEIVHDQEENYNESTDGENMGKKHPDEISSPAHYNLRQKKKSDK